MPAPHLGLERVSHLIRREFASLFCNHQLEGKMEQEIAQLIANGVDISFCQGMVQLQDLFDQIRS
jgi:hypothetical protein